MTKEKRCYMHVFDLRLKLYKMVVIFIRYSIAKNKGIV